MSEREKFEDAERRKFEAVARAICTASGSLPNQQMPLGGSMWMFYEDEARAAIQAVKPFYGPVIVHPDSSPDEMNLLYGEAYGVDWEYPPKAPRADQAAEIAALRTQLEEARKDAMNEGIGKAAAWVDARREAFMLANGHEDPSTGTWEYGSGPHAQAKLDYDSELAEGTCTCHGCKLTA